MRFLVVDDEAMIAETICDLFEDEGIDSESASSGEQALSALTRRPDVDALITDIDMPDMSALVLARRCRQIRPGLPVVVIRICRQGLPATRRTSGCHGKTLPSP